MAVVDTMAFALFLAAACAFVAGEVALGRANDLHGIYWLAVGIVSLRAAVQIARPGSKQ